MSYKGDSAWMKKSAYQALHSIPAIYVKFKHHHLEKEVERGDSQKSKVIHLL